jgi:hypothetical protein
MDDVNAAPTVEMSLEALSQALLRAVDDLTSAHGAIEMMREDLPPADAELSRQVIVEATRAVDRLKELDETLAALLKTLEAGQPSTEPEKRPAGA